MQAATGWQRQIAVWFGSGYWPRAPGTAASFAAVPVSCLLSHLGWRLHLVLGLGLGALGTLCAERYAQSVEREDPQEVVIDEVIGTMLALGLVRRRSALSQILAFALFRVLDITKPGLIDKAQELRPAGIGIMADDVLAGLVAGLLARWARPTR